MREGNTVIVEGRGNVVTTYGATIYDLPVGFRPAFASTYGLIALLNGSSLTQLIIEGNAVRKITTTASSLDFTIRIQTLEKFPAPALWPGTAL